MPSKPWRRQGLWIFRPIFSFLDELFIQQKWLHLRPWPLRSVHICRWWLSISLQCLKLVGLTSCKKWQNFHLSNSKPGDLDLDLQPWFHVAMATFVPFPPPKWPILCWVRRYTLLTHSLTSVPIQRPAFLREYISTITSKRSVTARGIIPKTKWLNPPSLPTKFPLFYLGKLEVP